MYSNYFNDKIALVTGGGSGIGRGLCKALAAAGAVVVCADIDLAKADETVAVIGQNARVSSVKLDVSQLGEVEAVMNTLVAQFGRIDIVFNNAGIAVTGELRDLSIADWEKVMGVNFYGLLYGSQTAYKLMLKQGSGQIVNTASGAGLVDYLALLAPYSASKHAAVNYTKILRLEAGSLGIKVSAVCPGAIKTSIVAHSTSANAGQNFRDYLFSEISKGISVDRAVDYILKGVVANREMIVFPFKLKIGIVLLGMSGSLFKVVIARMVKKYRKMYREQHS
jgi:NAD(P)-dependent dehydrogenase (short-subunit alcohol dehydrogenase family)